MSEPHLLPDDPRVWLKRAKSNLLRARSEIEGVYLEDLCFDAQQAAEKAIKAVLIYRGVRFPYSHDLAELLTLAEKTGGPIPDIVMQAAKITRYAVAARYPGVIEPVNRQEYSEAILLAENVLAWAEGVVQSKA